MAHALTILFIALFLAPAPVQAQSARAIRLYHYATAQMAARQFERAADLMRKAAAISSRDPKPWMTLGTWYYNAHRFREAAEAYRAGARGAGAGDSVFAMPLALALLRSGDAAAAASALAAVPLRKRVGEWTALNTTVQFAMETRRRPVADTVTSLGPRVNTPDAETFPVAKADGSLLLFTRRVGGMDEEFFRATPDSCGGWLTARALPAPPNTPAMESAQAVSADGHYLFFTRCEQRTESGWNGGGCDLYMAYTADGDRADSVRWSDPQAFGGTINGPGYEGMPCLSPDNRELFFASDRPGGYGGLDLWTSQFVDGLWQVPRNLGPAVNTPGDDMAPYLAADGATLYFSSNGRPETLGGRDLYRSRRAAAGDSVWTSVQNLGLPINTGYDEISISVHPDGSTALFSSDRGKGAGDYDVYSAALRHDIQPTPAAIVRGTVFDSISRERLNYARLILSDASTGQRLHDYLSNRGDGSYTLVLKTGFRYAVFTDRIGYGESYDTLYYEGARTSVPDGWNVALLPADYEAPVQEEMVMRLHFEKNSVQLSEEDKALVVATLERYATDTSTTVLINSYTDDSGTPMLNSQISELRARLVADVVEKMGVPRARIEAQGWADASPLAPNDSDANRKMNRRVEVVVRRR